MKKLVMFASLVVGLVASSMPTAHSLPSEQPTVPWAQVKSGQSRVQAIEIVNGVVFLAGYFTSVQDADGSVHAVDGFAAFDVSNGQFRGDLTPSFAGGGGNPPYVWDLDVRGDEVLLAGNFNNAANLAQANLAAVSAVDGDVRWFTAAPALKSVLAAPDGTVYAGGTSLTRWSGDGRTKLFNAKTKVAIDPGVPGRHNASPGYRDLMWWAGAVWAACGCDSAGGTNTKALIKLDANGNLDTSFSLVGKIGVGATGLSVATDNAGLYLGAGGSDFIAGVDAGGGGSVRWKRDTSGSTQGVEYFQGTVVIGGHFVEVADLGSDKCGFKSSNPGSLDPNNQCQTRNGLAVYSTSGVLRGWSPSLAGAYSLAWAIEPEGNALHIGGEFKTVNGVARLDYAKLP